MNSIGLKGLVTALALGVFFSAATAADEFKWSNVAIGGGGFVSAVLPSPIEAGVIYARTDVGGAYRWNDTTKAWIPLTDWTSVDERGLLGIEAMAVDPVTPGTVYMMAGTVYWNQAADGIGRSAFLRSKDYGATWEKIYVWDDVTKNFNAHGNGMGRGNGERLAVDPANPNIMFYGSRNKGMWKTTNNGTSWAKVTSAVLPDTTWNGAGFSFLMFDPSTKGADKTTRIYAGAVKEGNNVFVSNDAGTTWSVVPNRPIDTKYAPRLMPQRAVITPDGSNLYITFGDGAGPHTMAWDEGWGMIHDMFNRGAVYKYTVASQAWTNVSPQNLINPSADGSETKDYSLDTNYAGTYSGISIDPNNPNLLVVSSMSSYRGPQYWKINGVWKDCWGDNVFVSQDGGATWVSSFTYYWVDGGNSPTVEQMDANGFPWIVGNTMHWIGSVAIDPFNPKRVFATSGNGVFMTENVTNYTITKAVNSWDKDVINMNIIWKFASAGIEEVVPEDLVSIPSGPMVSVIGDYDGFRHDDIRTPSVLGRHKTNVGGTLASLGSTSGIALASKKGTLAKCAKTRSVALQYNSVPIGPVQYSNDSGTTWSVETYTSNPPTTLSGGKVALSADGATTLWMPGSGTTMYRSANSSWTTVSGIAFSARPVADQVNASKFYVFNRIDGYMYVSTDAGVTFIKKGLVGISNYGTVRAVPGVEGDLWAPVAKDDKTGALMHSTDGGTTFTAVTGVGYCEAVGFGKAAAGATFPSIFVYATIGGVTGVFQSIDQGANWTRVNDDGHEYGGLANGEFVIGDMNTFGVVYMSTAGRGIAVRVPSSWAMETPNTSGGSTTRTVKPLSLGSASASLDNGFLQLQVDNKPLVVEVVSLSGRVLNHQLVSMSTIVPLSLIVPSHGMYVLHVSSGKQALLTKVVGLIR